MSAFGQMLYHHVDAKHKACNWEGRNDEVTFCFLGKKLAMRSGIEMICFHSYMEKLERTIIDMNLNLIWDAGIKVFRFGLIFGLILFMYDVLMDLEILSGVG